VSSPVDRDRVRALLGMVRGVESVEVTGSNGTIDTIEVEVTPEEPTGRVVRDIESALATGLGLAIDHRCIRVVPAGSGERAAVGDGPASAEAAAAAIAQIASEEPVPASRRLRLAEVACEIEDPLRCDVTVTVESDDNRFTASVRDADTPRGRILSAARATLLAVERTLPAGTALLVEGVEEFEICEHEGLVAMVRARQGREIHTWFGCALFEAHPAETAARAVLDAVNRFAGVKSGTPPDAPAGSTAHERKGIRGR